VNSMGRWERIHNSTRRAEQTKIGWHVDSHASFCYCVLCLLCFADCGHCNGQWSTSHSHPYFKGKPTRYVARGSQYLPDSVSHQSFPTNNRLNKNRLHISNIPIFIQQLLNNSLVVMLLECFSPCISLEKVKHVANISVSGDAVVENPLFGCCESRCFSVDCFKGICVFGKRVDLAQTY